MSRGKYEHYLLHRRDHGDIVALFKNYLRYIVVPVHEIGDGEVCRYKSQSSHESFVTEHAG